jgi:hypothetical protein
MLVGVGIAIFIVVWIWIIWELYTAPLIDDVGNIDVTDVDIEDDLWDKNHIEDMD